MEVYDNYSENNQSPFLNKNLLIIAAHPDDEVLFAGSQLTKAKKLCIVHVTDGAPSVKIARRKGFRTRNEYSLARRAELYDALRIANVNARCECLNYRDGLSCLWIVEACNKLADLISSIQPDIILTHCYDGGHRDHDTTMAIVQIIAKRYSVLDKVWEMACYYNDDGKWLQYRFPNNLREKEYIIELGVNEKNKKIEMLKCFKSQEDIVNLFDINTERFRKSPSYNLKNPPLQGRLGYEINNLGAESNIWRALVKLSQMKFYGSRIASLQIIPMRLFMRILVYFYQIRIKYPEKTKFFEKIIIVFTYLILLNIE